MVNKRVLVLGIALLLLALVVGVAFADGQMGNVAWTYDGTYTLIANYNDYDVVVTTQFGGTFGIAAKDYVRIKGEFRLVSVVKR